MTGHGIVYFIFISAWLFLSAVVAGEVVCPPVAPPLVPGSVVAGPLEGTMPPNNEASGSNMF